jgi:hypothetical protein
MIEDQTLRDRLTAAAAEQDDLLPRALGDDLAAGRRRLHRRRALAGAGITGAAAVVGVLTLGVSSWLTPAADQAPVDPPVATQASTPPAETKPALGGQAAAFDQLMKTTLVAHLDPTMQHLDFSTGPFTINSQPGVRSGGGRAGWRINGQEGEGQVGFSVRPSASATDKKCGTTFRPKLTCHAKILPNGRTAMLGRRGDSADVTYVQPDGELVSVAVSPLFANNTDIPVHDMGITDAQLLALVQDPKLELPAMTSNEQSKEAKMKGYKPSRQEIHAAAVRALPGGKVTDGLWEDVPEQLAFQLNWRNGSVSETVEVGVDSSVTVSKCTDQLSLTQCQPITLPDGRKVMYGEGTRTFGNGPKYIMGATFRQPDGDSAFVRVIFPGTTAPANGITKEQILALLTDSTLDK